MLAGDNLVFMGASLGRRPSIRRTITGARTCAGAWRSKSQAVIPALLVERAGPPIIVITGVLGPKGLELRRP